MISYYVVCDIGYNSLDCDLKDEIIIIHLWFDMMFRELKCPGVRRLFDPRCLFEPRRLFRKYGILSFEFLLFLKTGKN